MRGAVRYMIKLFAVTVIYQKYLLAMRPYLMTFLKYIQGSITVNSTAPPLAHQVL